MVDWSRRPFDCDARPFRDSDQIVRVRWFPAAPEAVAIPWPSNLDVPDWMRSFELPEYPGTVPAEWPGNPYNRAAAVPGSGRGHVCGTREQFAGEAALDPDADMQYRPDGLPVCCDPVRELKGGAGAGVQASVSATTPGNDCPTAIVVDHGDSLAFSVPEGATLWYRFADLVNPGRGYCKVTLGAGSGLVIRGRLLGTSCSHITFFDLEGTGSCFILEPGPGDIAWFTISPQVSAGLAFGTVEFGFGFCP